MSPDPPPSVSVVIVSYNTRDLLVGCLRSLCRVADEALLEIIVIDNASTDGSAALVRERFPDVILIGNDRNIGFAAANNIGLAQAKSKFVFFLNPDTLVSRGTVVQLAEFLDKHPKAGAAGAALMYPDGTPLTSVLEFPNLWREFWNFIPEMKEVLVSVKRGLNSLIPFAAHPNREPKRAGAVSGAAMMVRAEAIREVGGFDEGFFLYHEERDLCYRLAKAGWEIWSVPGATVIHFDAQASGYKTSEFPREPILSYRVSGMNRLYQKHRPGWRHRAWRGWARFVLRLRGNGELAARLGNEN